MAVGSVLASSVARSAGLPLKVVADVPLSGGTTRWDYASFDGAGHRLYLAHLGDGVVTVFDTTSRRVVADIPHLAAVHGVLAVPEEHRVYASATGTHEVVTIDDRTFKVTARVRAGDYPDGLAYAPESHKLYVSDERGAADLVIDTGSKVGPKTIPLGGEAGNTQYDPGSKHIFVNVQTARQLLEIDPLTDSVLVRIALPGAEGNHGLAIDPVSRLAFIACEGNQRLLVLDLGSHRVFASFKVGKEPDVLAFDAARGWLYVASESGTVAAFEVRERTVRMLGSGRVGANAHVVAVDPLTHLVYFPLRNLEGKPVLRIMQPLN